MRPCLLLAALAAPALGADPRPLIESRGATLEAFEVVLDVARADHGSPRALALSYAAFDAAASDDVGARFARLYQEAHLRALRRTYVEELVERQRKEYAAAGPAARGVAFAVVEERAEGQERAAVLLERTWEARDPETGAYAPASLRVRLHLRREGRWWWVDRVEQAAAGGAFAARDLGVPPLVEVAAVPPEEPADLATPAAALRTLQRDMARLQALRARAQDALYRHYFDLVRAFYGEAIAERARKERPSPPRAPKVTHEFGEPERRQDGTLRITVTALEEIDAERGRHLPVGQASFSLARDALSEWRVVEEFHRPAPDAPLLPRTPSLGLFFGRQG